MNRRPGFRRSFTRRSRRAPNVFVRQTYSSGSFGALTNATATLDNTLKSDTFLGSNVDKIVDNITIHKIDYTSGFFLTAGNPTAGKLVLFAEMIFTTEFGIGGQPYSGSAIATFNEMSGSNAVGTFPAHVMWRRITPNATQGPSQYQLGMHTIRTKRRIDPSEGLVFHGEVISTDTAALTYQWWLLALIRYSVRT